MALEKSKNLKGTECSKSRRESSLTALGAGVLGSASNNRIAASTGLLLTLTGKRLKLSLQVKLLPINLQVGCKCQALPRHQVAGLRTHQEGRDARGWAGSR